MVLKFKVKRGCITVRVVLNKGLSYKRGGLERDVVLKWVVLPEGGLLSGVSLYRYLRIGSFTQCLCFFVLLIYTAFTLF